MKSKVWFVDTMTRTFRIEFDEPVYAQQAATALYEQYGIPGNAIMMIYA